MKLRVAKKVSSVVQWPSLASRWRKRTALAAHRKSLSYFRRHNKGYWRW